jgi:Ca2+-binding RTX toxin-like protein
LGLDGADTLDGGAGIDRLEGGLGDDIYILATSGDTVVELATAGMDGTDEVRAGYSYTLGANLENLVLTGTSAINGTGNSLANRITGNGAANVLKGWTARRDTLDGGAGIDRLEGGLGDDIYILATSGDTVVELATAGMDGTDEVRAGYSYTLGANLENLVLTGTSAINGTGNSLANRITGNGAANVLKGLDGNDTLLGLDGNDRLTGGGGKDSLTGGMGDDAFQFNGTLDGGDFIMDFSNVSGNNDHFRISAAGFGGGLVAGTTLAASQFRARADNLAQDSDDRFIFRTTDQTLWFDSNGNASGGLTLVADLQAGAVMTSADILLVA